MTALGRCECRNSWGHVLASGHDCGASPASSYCRANAVRIVTVPNDYGDSSNHGEHEAALCAPCAEYHEAKVGAR